MSKLWHIFKIVFLTKSQVSVERHLVNDALAYLPIHGNNTGACSLIVLFVFGLNVFESSCNLPGVCGPCVLRREKLVSYLFVFCCFIYMYVIHFSFLSHIYAFCCVYIFCVLCFPTHCTFCIYVIKSILCMIER